MELLTLLLTIGAIIVLVLWVLLSFAVFGIKERLDRIERTLATIEGHLRPPGEDQPTVQPEEQELSLEEAQQLFERYQAMDTSELEHLRDSDLQPGAWELLEAELARRE